MDMTRYGFSAEFDQAFREDKSIFGEVATRSLMRHLEQRVGFAPNVDVVPPLIEMKSPQECQEITQRLLKWRQDEEDKRQRLGIRA